MEFVKGHGTQNDFVLLPDLDGKLELTSSRVRAVCDRHVGLGADGVLRVVRAAAVPGAAVAADWFMDYRNADGSIAEMCGNGLRLYARYLVDAGLVDPGPLLVGTRGGLRPVLVPGSGEVSVDMGPATVLGESAAGLGGASFTGLVVDVGNPHLACLVDRPLESLDLSAPPDYDRALFPDGVNVEFVRPVADTTVAVRVYERGVGETRSCGTGTVAAVLAALHSRGRRTGAWAADTPGGRLQVGVTETTTMLTGPAVLGVRGQLDEAWWLAVDELPVPVGAGRPTTAAPA